MKQIVFATTIAVPFLALAQGALENPANNSTESGIGIISGWHCKATKVEAFIDGRSAGFAFVGSSRGDTSGICGGKTSTGYSLLLNFNELSRGAHNLKIYADGIQFGEANFNTTQSGGTAFLSNASKQVTVSDFPTPGSNATLTWSQSKQSFVVTSIFTSSTTSTANPTGLQKLYGNVTLSYKFNISPTIYTDKVNFSANNTDSNGVLGAVLSNRSAAIGCSFTKSSPEFVCVIPYSSGAKDVFLFDINSTGSISGKYEFCNAGVSTSDCADDLVFTPDGTVSGSVVQETSGARMGVNSQSRAAGLTDENTEIERKYSIKSSNYYLEAMNPITESPSSEGLMLIDGALKNALSNTRQ